MYHFAMNVFFTGGCERSWACHHVEANNNEARSLELDKPFASGAILGRSQQCCEHDVDFPSSVINLVVLSAVKIIFFDH